MSVEFNLVADDYFCNFNIQTTFALPTNRETVLHFCETVQKEFPDMGSFFKRDTGEYVLEGSHEPGSYRWLELAASGLSAGYYNPPNVEDAYYLQSWLLERSRYFLGVSALDIQALDVVIGFNLDYCGNRDAIVMETLLGGSVLGSIASETATKCIECEPAIVFSLDEDNSLQARVGFDTRNSQFQARSGVFENEPIGAYLTVRQYSQPDRPFELTTTLGKQNKICEDLCHRIVVPQIIEPLVLAIASGG